MSDWDDMETEWAEWKSDNKGLWRGIKLGIAGVFLAIGGMTSCYTVSQDEEAVVRRFGKYVRSEQPGLHLKLPWPIEKADCVRITEAKKQEFGFRTLKADVQTDNTLGQKGPR